ncbi:MAG: hypothetical protein M3Y24_01950 [Acidobacteriota bacterium]|nr:hypothetical protein [Acidobacteriota bacterium]
MLRITLYRMLCGGCLILGLARLSPAAEMQGVVADWNCVKPMLKNGREATLKQNRNCSMMKDYNRAAYGLITIDKKYYRLEDPGNAKIHQLLKGTQDKDNLKVIVTGDIDGDTIKVVNISEL